MAICEKCGKEKRDVFRRAEHGKRVCGECHAEIMRGDSPTGYVPKLNGVPEWLREGRDG